MRGLITVVTIPLVLLNLLGGLVGGVGLAIQGDWSQLIGGFLQGISGPFVISILLLPGLVFAPLVVWAAERGNIVLAVLAGLPSLAWTYIVLASTCIIVFAVINSKANGDFFHLLWGYSVAVGPWTYMAQKEAQSGNDYSATLVFFAQIGTVAMMVAAISNPGDITAASLAPWFLPFMALGLATQLFFVWAESRSTSVRGY